MSVSSKHTRSTREYWDSAADTYDQEFSNTNIGGLWREAVWKELKRVFKPGDRLLELNCGTGVDAMFLAEEGIEIVACDVSPRMIQLARRRQIELENPDMVDFRVLAIENISELQIEKPFDGAFSNFSGLNCVDDLSIVSKDLAELLRPGARVLLCMLGRFPAWRRLCRFLDRIKVDQFPKRETIDVQRPSVKEIVQAFSPHFSLRRWKGVGVVLPPAYCERWARSAPRLISMMATIEELVAGVPPLRSMGNCVLLELEYTPQGLRRESH